MPGLRLVRAATDCTALPELELYSPRPTRSHCSLLQYVQKDDGMFSWTDTGLRLNGTNDAVLPKNKVSWIGYVLNVTSQKVCAAARASYSVSALRAIARLVTHPPRLADVPVFCSPPLSSTAPAASGWSPPTSTSRPSAVCRAATSGGTSWSSSCRQTAVRCVQGARCCAIRCCA